MPLTSIVGTWRLAYCELLRLGELVGIERCVPRLEGPAAHAGADCSGFGHADAPDSGRAKCAARRDLSIGKETLLTLMTCRGAATRRPGRGQHQGYRGSHAQIAWVRRAGGRDAAARRARPDRRREWSRPCASAGSFRTACPPAREAPDLPGQVVECRSKGCQAQIEAARVDRVAGESGRRGATGKGSL